MPLMKEQHYTIEDIYNLKEGERAELIDGVIYDMAPPKRLHQKLVMELSATILSYIRSKDGNCEVYPAPFAVFLNNDDRNYVEPDVSVICDKNKLDDRGCNGAPDWIIEVVSQSSKQMDYFIKLFKYRSVGVREYWIVDPEKKNVRVYNFETEETLDYTFSDSVEVGIYEDFSIDFSTITSKE